VLADRTTSGSRALWGEAAVKDREPCRHRNGEALELGGMPKTVMSVEDNELNMKLFHDLLEAHGYHPIGTSDGIGALDLARKHRPDLILMDIQLPEVSGLEVTKWLKEDRELKAISGCRSDRVCDEGRRGAHPATSASLRARR